MSLILTNKPLAKPTSPTSPKENLNRAKTHDSIGNSKTTSMPPLLKTTSANSTTSDDIFNEGAPSTSTGRSSKLEKLIGQQLSGEMLKNPRDVKYIKNS